MTVRGNQRIVERVTRNVQRKSPSRTQHVRYTLNVPRYTNVAVTYRTAGVDVAGADEWLSRMRPRIRSTHSAAVLPDLGQFAGLFRLSALRLRDPVLVASADGVGTKLKVAQLIGAHEAIGVDVVAMNVNDILIYGARPLFFLDYLAIGRLNPTLMSALMRGMVRGCRQSGCALLGGETAEMPGMYRRDEYDVAGFCVGVAERATLIDGSTVRAGDAILGLASSGVHANGFSLVRRVFSPSALTRHARALLTPTRIYARPILQALARAPILAMAHITGGGLARRIPSLVSKARGARAVLRPGSWPVPSIFHAIQRAGAVSTEEMTRTFNMGIGMALVCRPAAAPRLIRSLQRSGVPTWPIGRIESGGCP